MLAILTSHPIQYQAPLWRALATAGLDMEVWFLTPHAVEKSFDREFGQTFAWDLDLRAGYRSRFLPIHPDWKLNQFLGVRLQESWRELFRRHRVTHLWIEGWRFAEYWAAIHVAHSCGIQVWLRGENNDLARPAGLKTWGRAVALRWLFAHVDEFLCIGSANRRFYLNYGVPAQKLRHAPYCVDNARFAASARDLRAQRAELRRRWRIEDTAFVFLFCGKLIAKKRPLDLVAAATRLRDECAGSRPLHLLFAGDGELAGEVRAALERAALPGTITGFLNQTEVPAAYAAADCLVLPSGEWETWGLVANEALASGLDIIVSDRCGCAEDLARPVHASRVFLSQDTADLQRAMTAAMRAPADPAAIAQIIAGYSPTRTVETVRQLLYPSATV